MNTEVAATYSMNSETGSINEGENFNESEQVGKKFIKDAREKYWPEYFKNKAAHFHDTPGVVDTNELLKYCLEPFLINKIKLEKGYLIYDFFG